MRNQKLVKKFLVTSALAAAGISTWVALLPQAAAAEPIHIGVMAPRGISVGTGIFQAAELAADQINAKGGIDGRKVKLYEFDDKFSASNAARAFQRAVQQDHVVAMVGIFTSEVGLAMEPWAARLKTPLIITGAASPKIEENVHKNYNRFKYVFHGYTNSTVLAREVCISSKYLLQKPALIQYNQAVIFSEDADWTKAVDAEYKKCLPKSGFHVVDSINFSPSTNDFTPLYNRIENDKANFIMAAIAHVGVKPVVQWRQNQVPAIFGGLNGQAGASNFWKKTNGATESVLTVTLGANGVPLTPKTPAFFKAYNAKFHTEEPVYDAYTTYDAMFTLKQAIERAGSTKANALVKAIEKTNMTGVTGHISYYGRNNKWTHEVRFSKDANKGQSFVIPQWQNGKQVVVWPERLAQGEVHVPSFVANSK